MCKVADACCSNTSGINLQKPVSRIVAEKRHEVVLQTRLERPKLLVPRNVLSNVFVRNTVGMSSASAADSIIAKFEQNETEKYVKMKS
jgi:hypothetical protein